MIFYHLPLERSLMEYKMEGANMFAGATMMERREG